MTLIDKDRYKQILQQAIRMVTVRPDADLMCKAELDNMKMAYEDALENLERMPDALIRCKECKHYDAENGDCEEICHLVGDEDYCSYGSRKGGEHGENMGETT